MISLGTEQVNLQLAVQADELADRLTRYLVNHNRDLNREYVTTTHTLHVVLLLSHYSLCHRYDEMSSKVCETPQTTDDLVQLTQYFFKVSSSSYYHCRYY